jgi:DNA topoisomerase-1
LEDEDHIFSIDLDGALKLLAEPKTRGRRAAAGPLRELGEDPVTKKNVVVRNGRFGLYVSDGEVNATLRIGDLPETITLDRACELLAERRNADPSTRPRKFAKKAAKKTTKKAAKKTTKKAAKKATAKKVTAKKVTAKKATAKKATAAEKRAAVKEGAQVNAALVAKAQHTDDE